MTAQIWGTLDPAATVDEAVVASVYGHLRGNLGWPEPHARSRAEQELLNTIGKAALATFASVLPVEGKRILDLGSGTGGAALEFARAGAVVTALEPWDEWVRLIGRRFEAAGLSATVCHGHGEAIPADDESFDGIVSLQVLEHVRDPALVIREAYRVLKPGGYFLLGCENYLSFWEPHYRVRWFPLLPKRLGSLWLRGLGRSPEFLQTSITYVTQPGVLRAMRRAGFVCLRDLQVRSKLRDLVGVALPDRLASLLVRAESARRLFSPDFSEIFLKPRRAD
ncbi:MAG: class I SAM-dependent methyltransferase [Polyangia bacterium]